MDCSADAQNVRIRENPLKSEGDDSKSHVSLKKVSVWS